MKTRMIVSLALVLLMFGPALAYANPHAPAAGGWNGYRGNSMGTAQSTYDASGNPGELKWTLDLDVNEENSPAMSPDGTIYIPGDNYAIEAVKDGKILWKFPETGYSGNLPHVSTPAIASNGDLYFGVDTEKKFYCLHPDGSVNWSFDMDGPYITTSPVISGIGNIYFGARFILYALSPSGNELWRFNAPSYIESLAVYGNTLYVSVASPNTLNYHAYLYAFDVVTGNILWRWSGEKYLGNLAVSPNGTVFFKGEDGYPPNNAYLYGVYDNHTVVRVRIGDSYAADPAIDSAKDRIIVACSKSDGNSKLYSFLSNGTEIWNRTISGYAQSLSLDASGNIFILVNDPSKGQVLYAFDSSGNERWNTDAGTSIYPPMIGPDGTIYLAPYETSSSLYALGTASTGGDEGGSGGDTGTGGSDDGGNSGGTDNGTDRTDSGNGSTPGFTALLFLISVGLSALLWRRKNL